MNEVNNQLSYKFIQNSIKNFRHLKGDNFNLYDEPGTYWFKPIFYFYRSTINASDSDINNEGLLHPSWINSDYFGDGHITNKPGSSVGSSERKAIVKKNFTTSAYNYLMRNDEEGRAKLLQQFITLLSNISSRSPWYFQEVAGLDTAIDHSEAFKEGKFVNDERKQITFTLLPDAVDDRIGTLFDLYRTVCYSWREKKEILPANLRKFDMGLYIHGSMIQNDASNILFSKLALSGALNIAEQLGTGYSPNSEYVNAAGKYKYSGNVGKGLAHAYLEFINCEIDLSSTKGGDTISNADGSERKYTLTISYDDCYVNRYNDFIHGAIGDAIEQDLRFSNYGDSIDRSLGRNSSDSISGKIINNVEGATLGKAKQAVSDTVGNMLLGNLYGFALTDTVRDIASGRVVSTAANEISKAFTGVAGTATSIGQTLYESLPVTLEDKPNKNIYRPIPQKMKVASLGNLYKSAGVVSNI